MNRKITIPFVLIVIALIILPTGTPEDLVTTLPIIGAIGMPTFVLLCFGIIGLLHATGTLGKLAGVVHMSPRALVAILALLIVVWAVMAE